MQKISCQRCGGTGKMDVFMHVEAGICFRCNGTGKSCPIKEFGNEQVVDVIYSFVDCTGEHPVFTQIYIWHEGTGKERAGTGHWFSRLLDPSKEDPQDFEGKGCEELLPLADLRLVYKRFAKAGHQLIDADEITKLFRPFSQY